MVVFASFVQQALSIGVTYTFGVLLVDLLRYFDEKESTTAWIGSIQPCLLYFTGDVIIYDALSSEPEVSQSRAHRSKCFGQLCSMFARLKSDNSKSDKHT